mgnify:CR=1 FL=1
MKSGNAKLGFAYVQTEIGLIEICGAEEGITAIRYVEAKTQSKYPAPSCVRDAVCQLEEYFFGRRSSFSVLLLPQGTVFQQKVWRFLQTIPYGQTLTYRELARATGNDRAVRAVGRANGSNPVNIIVPCHRVIGSDGSLTGYGGGLWRKEWLLAHERKIAGLS